MIFSARYLRLIMGFVMVLFVICTVSSIRAEASGNFPGAPIPAANILPNPNFNSSGACSGSGSGYVCANPCFTAQLTLPSFTNDPSCTAYVLGAINNARASLNEVPMELPSNWYTLTPPEQLFVLANLERMGLGYPPYLGLNAALSTAAQSAAQAEVDPSPPASFAVGRNAAGWLGIGGTWSEGFNALVADYYWIYADGWGGSAATTANIACTSATSAGCWGHRYDILGSNPGNEVGVGLGCTTCEMGAGYALVNGISSWDDLLELPAGSPPAMTFTWASEIAYFAPSDLPPTTTTTTVTTTPVKVKAPRTAFVKKLVLKSNFVSVSWSSPGTQGIKKVNLRTYLGKGCHVSAGGPDAYYAAFKNTSAGTISLRAPDWTDKRVTYSATIEVFNAGGSRTSRCISLGKS